MRIFSTFVVAASWMLSSEVNAAPITSLYGTGVLLNDSAGQPAQLVPDQASDPHYVIASSPSSSVPQTAFVTLQGRYPFAGSRYGVWASDDQFSKWISPQPNEDTVFEGVSSDPAGAYFYETTFTLDGLDSRTAAISGTLYADDIVADVFLNGASLGISAGTGTGGYYGTPFTIASGFQPGLNTLVFDVVNGQSFNPNPSGFRVSMSGSASIPEPKAFAFAALVFASLRRRR